MNLSRVRVFFLLCAAGSLSGYSCLSTLLRAELVAHWKLDEGEGEVFEDSVDGNDGFLPAGMTVAWDEGPPTQDHAVRFFGFDSFIATEFPGIGGREPRTVTFWLKTTDADAYMLGWGSTERGRKWHIRLEGQSGVVRTEFSGGQNYATTAINDGEWHHVASVFPEEATEGAELLHYVDGVLDPRSGGLTIAIDTAVGNGTADWSDGASAGSYYVHFGAVLGHGFARMLDGLLADVRIYDEELDQEGIRAIAEGEVPEPDVDHFVRGDANADRQTNLTDAVFTLNYLFLSGPTPSCVDAADADDNGRLNLTDGIYTLNYLFLAGPRFPAPVAECGPDPSEDELTCESFRPCLE